jgi:hypothetical protein
MPPEVVNYRQLLPEPVAGRSADALLDELFASLRPGDD